MTIHTATSRALGIRQAIGADIPQITATLGDAFLDTPDAQWLIPNRRARQTVYSSLCQMLADVALASGRIDITDDRAGVAVWHPVPAPAPDPDGYHRLIAQVCGRYTDRFMAMQATFAAHHPQQPHHHLAYLGVTPARQRRGIGTALLAHHHAELDAARLPAYLVAVSPQSRDLYLRHGYHIHGAGPFHLPDNGPPMWPLWRNPR
jgi:GNAT superfamily N-acetyltransferase